MQQPYKSDIRGLTLIEVSIILTLIGIFIVPVITTYKIYNTNSELKASDERILTIQTTLQRYAIMNGRYPRPSERSASPGDDSFGREITVADPTTIPECVADMGEVCRISNGTPAPEDDLLVGALPIASLGMPINFIADGFGSKFTYVVSEWQTTNANFGPPDNFNSQAFEGAGRIRIIGTDNQNIADMSSGLAHVLVFSHGQNRAGGFTIQGRLSQPCDLSKRESINCALQDNQFTNNMGLVGSGSNAAVQVHQSKGDDNTYYDDFLYYSNSTTKEIWTRVVSTSPDADIFTRLLGNIRIGANTDSDIAAPLPFSKLEVHGDLRTNKIQGPRLCPPRNDSATFADLFSGNIILEEALIDYDEAEAYGYVTIDDSNPLFVYSFEFFNPPKAMFPKRTAEGAVDLTSGAYEPAISPITPGLPLGPYVDRECLQPGDATGILGPDPIEPNVWTPRIMLDPSMFNSNNAEKPGGGIQCITTKGLRGWRNANEECVVVKYNSASGVPAPGQCSGSFAIGVDSNGSLICGNYP